MLSKGFVVQDRWDESLMTARGEALADTIIKIWRGPSLASQVRQRQQLIIKASVGGGHA